MPTLWDRLRAAFFWVLPHHAISRLVYRVTRAHGVWVPTLIRLFVRLYGINLAEADRRDPSDYATFNDFFTRALAPQARPVASDESTVVCPADGRISQIGQIRDGRMLQAKGQSFSVNELLGDHQELANEFVQGSFVTIYLSPRDYHRVHIPISGRLRTMIYVPGRLFPVGMFAARSIPRVFARNERVVAVFDSSAGTLAVILVGAINVAAIETTWAGLVTPPQRKRVDITNYAEKYRPMITRGQEMGRFNMGSTVIAIFQPNAVNWRGDLRERSVVHMGQTLGTLIAE